MILRIDPSRPAGSIDTPYRVRWFDDVLETASYWRLCEKFPGNEILGSHSIGLKDRLCSNQPGFAPFLDNHPEWSLLCAELRQNFRWLCAGVLGVDLSVADRVQIEFSSLPAVGGEVAPHPDTPKKVATAVLFLEPCWQPEWGGAFEVLRHRTTPDADFTNCVVPWDQVATVETVRVQPARILFMQRTKNSLHGVRPLMSPYPRRSLTINLIGHAHDGG